MPRETVSKLAALCGTTLLAGRRLRESNVVLFECSVHDGRPHLSMKCAPLGDQRICCLAVILRCRSLWTALSVCAVEIGSPERRAAAYLIIELNCPKTYVSNSRKTPVSFLM